ncbi:hypothetical protein LV564_04335 [Komagataeibacter nataicola]|uniref:hypothetical protein n=1 Tax=Komagataeibacter nataicola TaxID=265960 RepID=UPI001428AC76|nr:hypothetical protein [Komagataeibacter nataicola]WEQ56329.1 hypothetical protein LV564_04335 [Komagataeibacter nataicola]WNM07901.1 hypothetical protein RI056_12940 [Komagataeibacter nataicola]GBR14223.1 hypothetical protein AA0616_0260 [Komagataeibacter nataicola NRIC 0616]
MLHGLVHGLFNLGPLGGRGAVRISILRLYIPQPEGKNCKSAGAEEKNSARNKRIHARASLMPSCSFMTVLPIVRQIVHQSIWIGN